MGLIKGNRFAKPGVLSDASKLFGVPEKVWHQAFTGNFDKEMVKVRQRVEEVSQARARSDKIKKLIQPTKKAVEFTR